MTSDLVQNKYSNSKVETGLTYAQGLGGKIPTGLEITREQHFLDGTYDLFDVLAHHNQERDSLNRGINETISLLKRAQTTIENAEKKINAQNERIQSLEQLVTMDELTGLSNEQGLHEALEREAARMKRDEELNTLLVLVDLDNASAIKEQNGDEAHKAALKLIAKILGNEVRTMDVAARIGEDEFILMLPNTGIEKTLSRAQQLAKHLNRLSMVWGGHEINISVSIGLKSYGPNDRPESVLPSEISAV